MSLPPTNDTISAIATASGIAAVGIIRISGKQSFEIASKIFRSKKGKDILNLKAGQAIYGQIIADDELIDEAILLSFRAPNSYTTEDIVEIQSHGGPAILKKILELTVKHGARLAQAGEFTLRAFLNDRIDLVQAESILNLVNAQSDSARRNAAMGLNKNLSKKLDLIQTDITKVYASIQAVFDYPDEGVPDTEFREPLLSAIETIDSLLKTAKAGKISQQGAKLAIIGKPNVGKSSLLNTLLGYDRSIVSNIPGTTRDYLEVMLDINGVPVLAIDTAGLRETSDIIEEQGVVAAKDIAQNADLVLYLFDASQGLDGQRIDSKELNLKRTIVIANKVDLIDTNTKFENHIQKISVTNNQGIDKLKNLIKEKLIGDLSSTELWLTTERHEQALRQVKSHLQQALSVSEDLASIDLELALKALAEITGRSEISEETLEYIFANFCVGK